MCPRLLTIYGPLAVQSYGFMIITGLLIFLALTYYHPRRAQLISGDGYLNAVFTALFVGVVGGRVVVHDLFQDHVLFHVEIFLPQGRLHQG